MYGYIFSKKGLSYEVIMLGYSEQGARQYVNAHYSEVDASEWQVEVINSPTVIERELV